VVLAKYGKRVLQDLLGLLSLIFVFLLFVVDILSLNWEDGQNTFVGADD